MDACKHPTDIRMSFLPFWDDEPQKKGGELSRLKKDNLKWAKKKEMDGGRAGSSQQNLESSQKLVRAFWGKSNTSQQISSFEAGNQLIFAPKQAKGCQFKP